MMGRGRKYGTIVEIGDILVSEDVILEYFACDYPVCKGKCCIVGDSGAPLKEEELDPIEANYNVFSPLMRPEGRQAVEEKGFFEIDRDGDIVTPLVPGSEECAFCLFENGNCFCSIGSWTSAAAASDSISIAGTSAPAPLKRAGARESGSGSSSRNR